MSPEAEERISEDQHESSGGKLQLHSFPPASSKFSNIRTKALKNGRDKKGEAAEGRYFFFQKGGSIQPSLNEFQNEKLNWNELRNRLTERKGNRKS